MRLEDLLGKKLLFADGGMGTMLQAAGLPDGVIPDLWSVDNPEAVKNVHKSYVDAGCNIITTNTFGTNPVKLRGEKYSAVELARAAVKNAVQVVKNSGREDVFVALDIGPTGKLLAPLGDLKFEDAIKSFSETIKAGAEAGADAVIIETMSDTYEIKAAVIAAKESCSLPILCTMTFDEKGKLLTGGDIKVAAALLDNLGVSAIGLNCGLGPDGMLPIVEELKDLTALPIIVSPNAGLPKIKDGKSYFDVTPETYAKSMKKIAGAAAVIGGCCGTTPAHIKKMIDECQGTEVIKREEPNSLYVSSYIKSVKIDDMPIVIGERINPTGKKLFKQALRDNDIDYILREAIAQEEKGADILDVNVGLPEIDEAATLKKAIFEIQKVTGLPLQIDTSNYKAMEEALRLYNGKALVNSVNGKEESMENVLPLVKKYGAAVVVLTLDENGIPETVEGRVEIAKRVIDRALSLGIKKRDIIVDTLTLPISADKDAAKVTLGALKAVRRELGVRTALGVSNISFGLPERKIINSAFYTLALENGLNAGIINPLSEDMMCAYDAFCALRGFDEACGRYIGRHSGEKKEEASVQAEMTLCEAVISGLSEKASKIAKNMLDSKDSLEIINSELIPALDTVGAGFEKGKVFLPQLLMSAEAAKSAFDVIKAGMSKGEKSNGEKIVLATVHGDIHDIGKNIVKVLLENYGFDVIDLGKDVPSEDVVYAVIKNNAKLVGLSALMTTTVPSMEETIKLLHEKCKGVSTVVGGAVLNPEYAEMIGAEFYAKDAMETVRIAQKYFNN